MPRVTLANMVSWGQVTTVFGRPDGFPFDAPSIPRKAQKMSAAPCNTPPGSGLLVRRSKLVLSCILAALHWGCHGDGSFNPKSTAGEPVPRTPQANDILLFPASLKASSPIPLTEPASVPCEGDLAPFQCSWSGPGGKTFQFAAGSPKTVTPGPNTHLLLLPPESPDGDGSPLRGVWVSKVNSYPADKTYLFYPETRVGFDKAHQRSAVNPGSHDWKRSRVDTAPPWFDKLWLTLQKLGIRLSDVGQAAVASLIRAFATGGVWQAADSRPPRLRFGALIQSFEQKNDPSEPWDVELGCAYVRKEPKTIDGELCAVEVVTTRDVFRRTNRTMFRADQGAPPSHPVTYLADYSDPALDPSDSPRMFLVQRLLSEANVRDVDHYNDQSSKFSRKVQEHMVHKREFEELWKDDASGLELEGIDFQIIPRKYWAELALTMDTFEAGLATKGTQSWTFVQCNAEKPGHSRTWLCLVAPGESIVRAPYVWWDDGFMGQLQGNVDTNPKDTETLHRVVRYHGDTDTPTRELNAEKDWVVLEAIAKGPCDPAWGPALRQAKEKDVQAGMPVYVYGLRDPLDHDQTEPFVGTLSEVQPNDGGFYNISFNDSQTPERETLGAAVLIQVSDTELGPWRILGSLSATNGRTEWVVVPWASANR